jgi:predicted DNA-binding transcriptional regulator AlpA
MSTYQDPTLYPCELLTTKEATRVLGVSKAFLERDRWQGARVPFIKVGSRAVRYRLSDLQVYIESRLRLSTSQH